MKLIFIAAFHKKWPIDLRPLMWYKVTQMDTFTYNNSTIHHRSKSFINIQHAIKFIPVISNLCKVCTKKAPYEMVRMWWKETEHRLGECLWFFFHFRNFVENSNKTYTWVQINFFYSVDFLCMLNRFQRNEFHWIKIYIKFYLIFVAHQFSLALCRWVIRYFM